MLGGKPPLLAQAFMPAVGDRREPWIERRAELLDQRRQRIAEIAILALTKAMPRHDDVASEFFTVVVEDGDAVALLATQQAGQHRPPLRVEVGRRGRPVDRPSPLGRRDGAHAAFSIARSRRLR